MTNASVAGERRLRVICTKGMLEGKEIVIQLSPDGRNTTPGYFVKGDVEISYNPSTLSGYNYFIEAVSEMSHPEVLDAMITPLVFYRQNEDIYFPGTGSAGNPNNAKPYNNH